MAMSLQTSTVIRTLQRKLYRKAKERKLLHRRRLRPRLFSVCLTMKPVGEPDAGDRHVRFDERGWETERCRMAQVTAPILDSAIPSIRGNAAFRRSEADIALPMSEVADGRVEDGRGGMRPLANAPFPIPAHRTGRAALPHPALRLASPRGTRRCLQWQAFEA